MGLALAAGSGRRLLPLTAERAKVLCPVAGTSLLGHAIDRVREVCQQAAVNVFADAAAVLREIDRIDEASGSLDGVRGETRIIRSVEHGEARGTAGAIGLLRPMLDGRGVLAVNADSWSNVDLAGAVASWDGERPLVVHTGDHFVPGCGVVASITPWSIASTLPETPLGLYQAVWGPRLGTTALQTVSVAGAGYFVDCGTPTRYFAANLYAAGLGVGSAVDATAQVDGTVTRCVVWDHAHVRVDERLVDAIRTTRGLTIRFR